MNSQKIIYQVSDLVNEMRSLMEASYPEIWIEGELSSLSTPASGHLYFTLKDANSQLRCAMFRGRASVNRYQAKEGDLVRVRAKISVYPARGDLQCIVQYMEDAGEGILLRKYEELKNKLNQEGLFSVEHKQAIPDPVAHLAIITSPSGAALKDILTTLKRRNPGIPVTIYPAVVQGPQASKTLIQAIQDIVQDQRCDLIIMGRGGGSLEDLWCFNDEQLARQIFNCPIPIVSAVGHEVDVTIADLVADLRAPTPTAAAELVSSDIASKQQQLAASWHRLRYSCNRQLEKLAQQVDLCFEKIEHPRQSIRANRNRLGNLSLHFKRIMQSSLASHKRSLQFSLHRFNSHTPHLKIQEGERKLMSLADRLRVANEASQKSQLRKIESLASQLHIVSPLATMERGFAIARNAQQEIIRDSQTVNAGEIIEVELKSGRLDCEIKGKSNV